MKYLAQLSTLAVSVLLLSIPVNTSPTANLEMREPIPAAAPAPVPALVSDTQLSAPAELEKRAKKPKGSSNDTSDATSIASDGTLRMAGVAFLSSAMFLMT